MLEGTASGLCAVVGVVGQNKHWVVLQIPSK